MREEKLPELAKAFFEALDKSVGPFDKPYQFRPFPFDVGGILNFLTVGAGHKKIVTYVSWDLFGHPKQKRGRLGRYELLVNSDDEDWVLKILTNIGRQSLSELFKFGDSLDIGSWSKSGTKIQGVVFAEEIGIRLSEKFVKERCGLLRCIGVTRPELEYATRHGVPSLVDRLKRAGIYPNTINERNSIVLK